MPQMAPLSWTTLFLTFILIYMLVSTKVYFLTFPISKNSTTLTPVAKKMMNWKW